MGEAFIIAQRLMPLLWSSPYGGGDKSGVPIMKEKVLQAMREAGKPVSAGDVTKTLGVDRKEVDKAFAELKKEGAIKLKTIKQ